ncbi:MAG: hypothetical protein VX733_13305 [Candidatus Latescibacterota bacterium]|nr:hypothetical protein [Candidatus Latescibacterota bacterium]
MIRLLLKVTLWLAIFANAVAQPRVDNLFDFDGDGTVGIADYERFRSAFVDGDDAYDLNGDGQVDFGDYFLFAEHVEQVEEFAEQQEEGPTPRPPALSYRVRHGHAGLELDMPEYHVVLSRSDPFGITSLRLNEQSSDFAHPSLPLADWEWFRFQELGKQIAIKLIERNWGAPTLSLHVDVATVTYGKRDVLRRGVDLEVAFHFYPKATAFHVIYTLTNRSERTVRSPYAMVGFPGFSDHRYVATVSTGHQRREALLGSFWSEAQMRGLSDYLLLRQDARPTRLESLRNSLVIPEAGTDYQLSTYVLVTPQDLRAYAAHTNKPRYLTSHLYTTLADLRPTRSASIVVHYILAGASSTDTNFQENN